jgi:hypothetical protein
MPEPDGTFISETLKKIHARQADMRNAMTDMRNDMRDLKASNAMILGMIGEMVKGSARDDDRFARIEDLEHRSDTDPSR